MIVIELVDGTKHHNDPKHGFNLAYAEDIQECLQDSGQYLLTFPNGGHKKFSKDEVRDVYEINSESRTGHVPVTATPS